jgi:hypothetical protein
MADNCQGICEATEVVACKACSNSHLLLQIIFDVCVYQTRRQC